MTTKNYRELAKVQVERELHNEVNNLKTGRDRLMDGAATDTERDEVKKEYDDKIAALLLTKDERIDKLAAELEFVDDEQKNRDDHDDAPKPKKDKETDNRLWWVLGGLVAALLIGFVIYDIAKDDEQKPLAVASDTGAIDTTVNTAAVPEPTPIPPKDDCCDKIGELSGEVENLSAVVLTLNKRQGEQGEQIAKLEKENQDQGGQLLDHEDRIKALEEAKRKADEAKAKAAENAKKRRGQSPTDRLAAEIAALKEQMPKKADKEWVEQLVGQRTGDAPKPTPPQTVYVTPTDKGGHGIRKVGD